MYHFTVLGFKIMRPIPQTRIPGPAPADLNIAYRSSKTYWHVFKIGPEPVDVSDSYCHLGSVFSKSLSTKMNMQDACTNLRATYLSVVNGGIDVTSVNFYVQ